MRLNPPRHQVYIFDEYYHKNVTIKNSPTYIFAIKVDFYLICYIHSREMKVGC